MNRKLKAALLMAPLTTLVVAVAVTAALAGFWAPVVIFGVLGSAAMFGWGLSVWIWED